LPPDDLEGDEYELFPEDLDGDEYDLVFDLDGEE
jgi:hypothetical protein